MKKIIVTVLVLVTAPSFAAPTGFYVGGGLGYAMQNLTADGSSSVQTSTGVRAFAGYQMFSFLGAEAGYTYLSQADNWNNLGNPSTTIYDIAITPGIPIPILPLTVYGRLGFDAVSANLNTGWSSQLISTMNGGVEWGGGLKLDIPATNVFIRAEYINYGSVPNNSNSNVTVNPSAVMLDAAYVF